MSDNLEYKLFNLTLDNLMESMVKILDRVEKIEKDIIKINHTIKETQDV
jgi:hypothetical protein